MSIRARQVMAFTALVVASLSASAVWAVPIPIADPGFAVFQTGTMTPAADDRFAGTVGGPQTASPLSVASTGAATNELADIPAGWQSAGGGNGRFRDDIEFLVPTGPMAGAVSEDPTVFFQNLGIPVAPNTIYVATINLIDRNTIPIAGFDATAISANPNFALLADLGGAGQTTLPGILTFVPPPNGGTSIMTLVVTTGPTVPAGNLFIAASAVGGNSEGKPATQTFFDNATLDATGIIPEPGSMLLLGLGGSALMLARRRPSRLR